MPENLRIKGINAFIKDISDQEYLALLKEKVVEEAKEVYESKDRTELVEEMADVLEVISALAKAHAISAAELEECVYKNVPNAVALKAKLIALSLRWMKLIPILATI